MSMTGAGQGSGAKYRAAWRERWRWALAFLLLGPLAGYALARLLPQMYVSSATLAWLQPAAGAGGVQPGTAENSAAALAILVERRLTAERLAEVSARIGLYARENIGAAGVQPAARMRRDLVVTPAAHGLTVSFSAGDARLAQQACAAIVALLAEEKRAGGDGGSLAASSALAQQLQEAKRRLDQAEAKLAQFDRRHIGELNHTGADEAESSLLAANARLAETNAALDRAREDKALTESLLRQQLAAWHGTQTAATSATQTLEQELAQKQAQLVALETRYTHDYPDVVKLRNDIAELGKKLDDARRSAPPAPPQNPEVAAPGEPAQIAQSRAQIHQLELTIQQKTAEKQRVVQEIQTAEARQAAEASLVRESETLNGSYKAAQAAYESVLAKQEQTNAALAAQENRSAAQLQVTEPASLPSEPSSPRPLVFTLGGAAAGIGLGLLTILLGAWSDATLRTESDVERCLGLPTLAVIPTTGAPAGSVQEDVRGSGRGKGGTKQEGVLVDV